MREIINLSVGQGGNQIGKYFWEALCNEHSLNLHGVPIKCNEYQSECLNVYFNEVKEGQFQARSLQIDGEPGLLDDIRQSELGNIFSQSSYIFGQCGAGNCFGKGRYDLDIEDNVLDEVRKLVESCDCLQGFQLMRSLGGGTGSGFGDQIQSKVREEYSEKMIANFCIFPSPYVSDTVVEPYNSVLSTQGIFENQDLCFVLDNGSLYQIVNKIIGIQQPNYKQLNQLLQKFISGATTQWRFPSTIYNDMRKLTMNLIPFPRLNFINTGLAPIYHQDYIPPSNLGAAEMIRILKNNRNFIAHTKNINNFVEFGSLAVLRGGSHGDQEVIEENQKAYQFEKKYRDFWIPDSQKILSCRQTLNNERTESAVRMTSGSSVNEMLQTQLDRFSVMFKRKAFLHYGFGNMDEMEFVEAQSYLTDVIAEYTSLENDIYSSNFDKGEEEEKQEEKTFSEISNEFISIQFSS